jgi:hypothetical protein
MSQSDAGQRPDAGAPRDEDRELIEHLDLLLNLEGAVDLDLLQELGPER